MRANVTGWATSSGPARRGRRDRRQPVGDARRGASEQHPHARVGRARPPGRCAPPSAASSADGRRGSRRRRRPAPAGRRGRGRAGRAGSTRRCRRTRPRGRRSSRAIAARSTMPACAMTSAGGECFSTSRAEAVRDRRQPAPAVDQDRHVTLRGEREHRLEPRVVGEEALGARMELDPARAGVERSARPPRSASRSGRAARTARASPSEAAACTSVRSLAAEKRGMAVGLVEAEHERARDPVGALDPRAARRDRRPSRRCRRRGGCGRRRPRCPPAARRGRAPRSARAARSRDRGRPPSQCTAQVGRPCPDAAARPRRSTKTAPGPLRPRPGGRRRRSPGRRARRGGRPRWGTRTASIAMRRDRAAERARSGSPAARPAGSAVRSG